MQLTLPEDNSKKLKQIEQQKKRLKDRIQRIQKTEQGSQKQTELTYEENMKSLLERKRKLQEQKQRQYNLRKMQDEYLQRRKQMERQKRMEQLQNQKRMIQLQTGVKRMVFQATKQKVKGMNSEQLMMRALMRNGLQQQGTKSKTYSSKGNVRRDFQKFLETEHRSDMKQKWDIYELNEKRFKVFEKKQQTIMRKVLLKQLIQKGKDEQINVLKLSKKQLEIMLEQLGIDINDYLHPVSKEEIIERMPEITHFSKLRIEQHKKYAQRQKQQNRKMEKQKGQLKQFLLLKPTDIVRISRSIVYDLIHDIIFNYEKRLNRYQMSEFEGVRTELNNRHGQIIQESQNYQHAKIITLMLLDRIHEEFMLEAAEEVTKLHDFAHKKTEECFQWMFSRNTNIAKKLNDISSVDIELNFKDDDNNENIKQPIKKNQFKKEDYLKKLEDYQTNIFDIDKLTSQIINEINILDIQAKYFKNISVKVHGEKDGPEGIFHILYDRQFYAITNEAVHNAKKIKVKLQKLGINPKLQILKWQKVHNFWLIHDTEKVSLYSPWGLEILQNQIGQRVGNLCGKIISAEIFPIFTMLGQTCSIVLGFQKGQILKYNMNLNRIQNSQTNLSFYTPLFPHIRSEQQPPFPLQKKNTIKAENKKLTQNAEIHQFRQFFDHHTTAVVGICFYKYNKFITVDKNLKCALWFYQYKQGVKCFTPAYTFQFTGSESIFKQVQNSRFRNVYPSGDTNQSPQELYHKWMRSEAFLKKLIYNNPKKGHAHYRVNDYKQNEGEVPIWNIFYDQRSERVTKIHQSYYLSQTGKLQGKSCKIWRHYLMVLCERDHKIRQDFKTVKIFGWDIDERKMRSISLEVDVFKQAETQFQILENMLVGVDTQLAAIVSSGRIIIFSLMSGQIVKNISDAEYLEQPKYANYYFTEITAKKSVLGAATKTNTMEISLNDHNNFNEQKQLNDAIGEVSKKYVNLL